MNYLNLKLNSKRNVSSQQTYRKTSILKSGQLSTQALSSIKMIIEKTYSNIIENNRNEEPLKKHSAQCLFNKYVTQEQFKQKHIKSQGKLDRRKKSLIITSEESKKKQKSINLHLCNIQIPIMVNLSTKKINPKINLRKTIPIEPINKNSELLKRKSLEKQEENNNFLQQQINIFSKNQSLYMKNQKINTIQNKSLKIQPRYSKDRCQQSIKDIQNRQKYINSKMIEIFNINLSSKNHIKNIGNQLKQTHKLKIDITKKFPFLQHGNLEYSKKSKVLLIDQRKSKRQEFCLSPTKSSSETHA